MIDYNELPLGLGLAFAANRMAMDRFVDMTDDEKIDVVAARILKKYKPAFLELAK